MTRINKLYGCANDINEEILLQLPCIYSEIDRDIERECGEKCQRHSFIHSFVRFIHL